MQNQKEDSMIKHSRKHSSMNKNIRSHQTSENVTKSVVVEEDGDTIHMFSKLNISAKSSQLSSCDQESLSDPSGSSSDSHSNSFPESQALGITQHKHRDQAG